jgi:hypothetical protein
LACLRFFYIKQYSWIKILKPIINTEYYNGKADSQL